MAEALSQSQIDALLNSMANGGFEEEKRKKPQKKNIGNMIFIVLKNLQKIN